MDGPVTKTGSRERLFALARALGADPTVAATAQAVESAVRDLDEAMTGHGERVERLVYKPGMNCRESYEFVGMAWESGPFAHEVWRMDELGGRGEPCGVACPSTALILPDGQEVWPGETIVRRGACWRVLFRGGAVGVSSAVLVAVVTFSVAAASSSPGEVVSWSGPGGLSSVSRSWEAPRDAGCRVVFLPGDEEPSDGDEDPGGLWASGAEPGYTSRMRDAAVKAGCGFSQLRTPDRVSGTWYKQGERNAAWIRSWVSAHTRPTDRVWFVGYSGGAQEFRYLTAAYAGRMPPGGAVLFGGGGPAGGGPAAAPAGYRVVRVTGELDTAGNASDGYDALGDAKAGHAADIEGGARASLETPGVDHGGVIDHMGAAVGRVLKESPATGAGVSEGESMIASAVVAGAMVLGGGATEPTPAATEEVKSPAAVSQQASVGEGTSTGQPTEQATSGVPSGIGVPTVPFAQPTQQSTQEPSADSTAPGLAPVTPTQVPQTGGFGSWIFPLFIGADGRPAQPTAEQQSGFAAWFQGLFGGQPQITAPAPQAPAQGVPAPSSDPTLGLALPGTQPSQPSESPTQGGGEVAGDSEDHNSEEGQDKAGEADQGGGKGQDDGKDSKSDSGSGE